MYKVLAVGNGKFMVVNREGVPVNGELYGYAQTRAQLDELAQKAEGSHRQHMGETDA